MNVENFWRQIKHRYLHDYVRPRLDHLVWILIKVVTPRYFEQLNQLDDTYRMGRSKTLSWAESSLKRHWRKLQDAPVSEKAYNVNKKMWTCTCGQQKYEAHHLCKHLVKAIQPPPPPEFFQEVYRHRVAPLYKHRLLDPELDYSELEDGSITDGDDKKIYGSKQKAFAGERWKDVLESTSSAKRAFVSTARDDDVGKRRRTEHSNPTSAPTSVPPSASTTPPLAPADLDVPFDVAMSSPGTVGAHSEPDYVSSDAYSRLTSPMSASEDEMTAEQEVSTFVGHGSETIITHTLPHRKQRSWNSSGQPPRGSETQRI